MHTPTPSVTETPMILYCTTGKSRVCNTIHKIRGTGLETCHVSALARYKFYGPSMLSRITRRRQGRWSSVLRSLWDYWHKPVDSVKTVSVYFKPSDGAVLEVFLLFLKLFIYGRQCMNHSEVITIQLQDNTFFKGKNELP